MPNFTLIRLYCRLREAINPKFHKFSNSIFWWRRFVGRIDTRAQLQTFPYPMIGRSIITQLLFTKQKMVV